MLILIEVKSMRAALGVRLGSPGFVTDLVKRLDAAMNQLDRTSALINDRHHSFVHLPANAIRVGVVITAEPLYTANSSPLRSQLSAQSIPTLVMSLRELERLVAHDAATVFAALRQIATGPTRSTWPLSSALADTISEAPGHSPLVRQALDEISFDPPAKTDAPPSG